MLIKRKTEKPIGFKVDNVSLDEYTNLNTLAHRLQKTQEQKRNSIDK